MCGIVGVITKNKNGFMQKEIDIFNQLLYADALRGQDGTGIFYNSKKNKAHVRVLKGAFSSPAFLKSKEYIDATKILYNDSNFVMGHNRSATKGKIDFDCTHPFREQHITLIHNGTLPNHKDLHKDEKVTVDSHAICHSITTIGAEETLKKIDGAFALSWFDAKERTLNFCRNSQRPLHIIEIFTSWIICSELELGLWILKRNNMTVITQSEIPTETLVQFNLNDMSKKIEKPVEFKKWVQSYTQPLYKNNYSHDYDDVFPHVASKYQPPIDVLPTLSVGDKIKFKSGVIKRQHAQVYLEGFMLKNQNQSDNWMLLSVDFIKTENIKVYGTENELKEIALESKLIGEIDRAVHIGENTTYHVKNVMKYGIKKEEPKTNCPWCKAKMEGEYVLYGIEVCKDCFTEHGEDIKDIKKLN